MNKSRLERVLKSLMAVAVVLIFLVSTFSAAYLLSAVIYQRLGLAPSDWLRQIGNLLLGLLITVLVMGLILRIAQARGMTPEMRAFQPLLKAMQQIARGDFSVRLDNSFNRGEPLGHLVESVNTMAEQLSQMEQLRQEFISDVSHEIQSPLTSIHGFAQALRNDDLRADERAAYLDIIMSESTRLGRITDNLLRLAALDSDQAKFSPHAYRLDRQIRELILACEPQWAAKGIDVDACLDSISITADEDLLSQVWMNLISNSIKFTPPGGRVQVELRQRDGAVECRVVDTGIGIAAADQPRLFERFYKVDKARTQSSGGSGLGLSIVKKIVQMHHGSVVVASAPGAGATFTVTLPIQQPAEHAAEVNRGQIRSH